MTVLWWAIGIVAAARLLELLYAAQNTRRLLARGATEIDAGHYPLFIALHASWLASMALVGARSESVSVHWWLLALFAGLQFVRIWIVRTLGLHWTTRIITLPGEPLVRSGPYRFLRHPNYVVVVLEIAVLPLAFGQIVVALLFSLLNAALLTYRIREENAALASRRALR